MRLFVLTKQRFSSSCCQKQLKPCPSPGFHHQAIKLPPINCNTVFVCELGAASHYEGLIAPFKSSDSRNLSAQPELWEEKN